MDNVQVGWNEPQEDEFALCSMGLPSPYLRIAFPKTGDHYLQWLDMEGLSSAQLAEWQSRFDRFLRRMTLHSQKRLILKSPTHTGRLKLLDKAYPDARFIHIVRNPLSIVPSTVKLWDTLDDAQGLQRRSSELDDFIFASFRRMYDAFERARPSLPPNRIVDVRYEVIVDNPMAELERVYGQLELGDFERVRPKLQRLLDTKRGYQTNQYSISPELRDRIATHFRDYCQTYGYDIGF
jgi:hypothetical protein